MKEAGTKNGTLLAQFVATFRVLDDTVFFEELDPEAVPLANGRIDDLGFKHWEPRAVVTPRSALFGSMKGSPRSSRLCTRRSFSLIGGQRSTSVSLPSLRTRSARTSLG